VDAVVLIGRDARLLESALEGVAPLYRARGLRDAVERAARLSRPRGRVLFSPACASFDMFDDYRARGDAFVRLVGRQPCR
jgi:UDP-N-acetylmuramoylalanine--D-glutamate ligase